MMKDIRKENVVKATTLSEEEMIEVVGGATTKTIVGRDVWRKNLSWLRKRIF